jgi:hypothetical protein
VYIHREKREFCYKTMRARYVDRHFEIVITMHQRQTLVEVLHVSHSDIMLACLQKVN